MTINHNHYLDLAFHLAEKNLGQTKLNPSVGTVIVKNGAVISTGVTSFQGRPHSEFNAFANKFRIFGKTSQNEARHAFFLMCFYATQLSLLSLQFVVVHVHFCCRVILYYVESAVNRQPGFRSGVGLDQFIFE